MSIGDFQVRRTEPSDMQDLNDLYQLLTGRIRTRAKFEWEWLNCFEGPAPSWVILEKKSKRLVGHHGVVPVPLMYQGQICRAARTENTMVHPEFRGKFPYHVFEAQLLRELLQTYDAIFTTSGKGAPLAVRKRLGYYEVGTWHSYRLRLTIGYFVRRLAAKALNTPHAARALKLRSHDDFNVLGSDYPEFERALGQMSNPAGSVNVANHAEYFRWRLAEHPYAKRGTCVFSVGDVTGVAAWRTQSRLGAVAVAIEHFALQTEEPQMWLEALRKLCETFAHAAPVSVSLRCIANNGLLASTAASLSPKDETNEPREGAAKLLVRSDRLAADTIWNVSPMITQAI